MLDHAKDENLRPLDRKSVVPLYHQLFIELRRRLLSGEWVAGDAFPKDSDIEEAYDVSRITVRQAVSQLVDANLVIRYRGRGSFVGNIPRGDALVNHRIVADEIAALGHIATHENIGSVERYEVSDLTAEQLQCEVGATVAILNRVHFADRTPFCLETIMLLEDRFPGVFDKVAAEEESLSEAYERYGIEVAKSEQTVRASMLSDERRAKLALPADQPALVVERIGLSAQGEPLDVRRLFYRGDRFQLRQEIVWGGGMNRVV